MVLNDFDAGVFNLRAAQCIKLSEGGRVSSMQTGRLHNTAKWLTCALGLAVGLSGTATAQASADESETPNNDLSLIHI